MLLVGSFVSIGIYKNLLKFRSLSERRTAGVVLGKILDLCLEQFN